MKLPGSAVKDQSHVYKCVNAITVEAYSAVVRQQGLRVNIVILDNLRETAGDNCCAHGQCINAPVH